MPIEQIRNFCIISHVDHGKSTLADRFLEMTGTVAKRNLRSQMLDAMELEREKGITIKLTPVRMRFHYGNQDMVLNLIDTPGHVDFSTEVSRSLAAVEGALLLVDATQGVQAQTLAHLDLAKNLGLTIVPVVNKIDLESADRDGVSAELAALTGMPVSAVLAVSAKTGEGVPALLAAIVERIPPPRGNADAPLRALVFDSTYHPHHGVVVYVRVVDGRVRTNEPLAFGASPAEPTALEVGTLTPEETATGILNAGEIGYLATGLRDVSQARVGDTVLHRADRGRVAPLPGYQVPQPNVYAGLYPSAGTDYSRLREALTKLQLSDAALTLEPEQSAALGQGFRVGFLGLLHVEIVRERLWREYGVEVTLTVPSVSYRVALTSGEVRKVKSAAEFPDPSSIRGSTEPWARLRILARSGDMGAVLNLLAQRQSSTTSTESLSTGRLAISAELPLRVVIVNFHDDLKAATSGYGSHTLGIIDDRPIDLVKLTILVHHEPVEALSVLLPRSSAFAEGRRIVARLKDAIPRHLFPIPLQALIGGKIVARETIPALRKDVTGYLYGGDVTRKRKLLEKQKRGKKSLAGRSAVTIPPSAYLAVLQR